MDMILIHVTSRTSGERLGTVQLPSFCVDHMRMTPAEVNLATMIKHVERCCSGVKVSKVFVNNEARSGITAEEAATGMTLQIE